MLAKEGYRSLFVKKPLAPGINFNPHLEDGCSLFYRVSTNPAGGVDDGGGGVRRAEAVDAGLVSDERDSGATTLDLLDAHMFTLAVVEEDDTCVEEGGGAGEGSDPKKPAERVASNQVAAIALLSITSAGSGNGDEALVIVTTTHLKAAKDSHGEIIRARQVSSLDRERRGMQ